jgi:type II secretory pathway pseudopilin PulG
MKHPHQGSQAFTLIETLFTAVLIGVLGILVYSLLNIGTILGAKNSAVNVAHQTARIAMLQMNQDFHSAVSPFQLVDANGNNIAGTGPAAGVAFHLWSKDTTGKDSPPFRVKNDNDAAAGQNTIHIVATTATKPVVGQWLMIPTHQIQLQITGVSGTSDCTLTLASNLPVEVDGTSGNIACFVTDRCSYIVNNGALQWSGPNFKKIFTNAVLGQNITNATPFSTPTTISGAPITQSVAAIDLSTADNTYSNRGFKAANILLSGQIPARANLLE